MRAAGEVRQARARWAPVPASRSRIVFKQTLVITVPFAYYDKLSPARQRIYRKSDAIETLGHPAGAGAWACHRRDRRRVAPGGPRQRADVRVRVSSTRCSRDTASPGRA